MLAILNLGLQLSSIRMVSRKPNFPLGIKVVKVLLYCKVNNSFLHPGVVEESLLAKTFFPFKKAPARGPKFKAQSIFLVLKTRGNAAFLYEG